MEKALALQYNPLLIFVGNLAHSAPRILRLVVVLSVSTDVFSSIIAGCTQSTSFARAYLHEILAETHADIPPSLDIKELVDDLAQTGRGKDIDELAVVSPQASRGELKEQG